MSSKYIEVPLDHRWLAVECDNCNMQFVLSGVLERIDEYENVYHTVIPQSDRVFCPYCGDRIRES